MKKYELLMDQSIKVFDRTLFRIRALVSFSDVEEGEIGGYVEKEGNLDQSGNAWVYGNARVSGDAWVSGNARVYACRHIFSAGPIGSRNDTITFFRTKELQIAVKIGCFTGTIAEFRAKVAETHGDSIHGKTYRLLADVAEQWINLAGDETSASDHVGR